MSFRVKRTPAYRPAGVTIGGGPGENRPNLYIKYHQMRLDQIKAIDALPPGKRMDVLPALSPNVKKGVKTGLMSIDPRELADKLVSTKVLAAYKMGEEIRLLLPQEGLVDTFITYRLREVLEAMQFPTDTALPFIEILNRPFSSWSHPGTDRIVRERFKENHNLWTKMARADFTVGEALLTLQFVEVYKVAKEQGWI